MKTFCILLAFLCCYSLVVSQQIDITVKNLNVERTVLSSLSGETATKIDSFSSSGKGKFLFSLSGDKYHLGFYRLSFEQNKWVDFINDNENVTIITDSDNIFDSLHIISSESNLLYYSFQKLNKRYKTKTDVLQLVLARYPKDDAYYTTTQTTVAQIQQEYENFINSSQTKPSSFIARYVFSSQLPVIDFTLPLEKQLAYLKAHDLDKVNFNDAELLNSDLFTNKAIEYLMYYRNPQLPRELLAKEFNTAVDTILGKAKINQTVYQHLTKYLIDGFKKFGFEECINYILDNYAIKDDLCLDERSGSTIQRMIDQKKNLPTGSVVPNISLPDSSGNFVSLTSLNASKILILFYSSSCPHCRTMIPKLQEYYTNKKDRTLTIFAISLDDNRNDWLNFLKSQNLPWTNVNDPEGWNGKAASEYFIYATPSMFLLDKEKKIISKPTTIEELLKSL